MKKKARKLSLHRETVGKLDPSHLRGVVGGTGYTHDYAACGTSCRCRDFVDTFSAECTLECPQTSQG
jgi:hypothetical protein